MKRFSIIIAIILIQGLTSIISAQGNRSTTMNGNRNVVQTVGKGNIFNISLVFNSMKSNSEREKLLNKIIDSLSQSLNLKECALNSKIDSLDLKIDSLSSFKSFISKQNHSILSYIDSVSNLIMTEKKIMYDTIQILQKEYNEQLAIVEKLKKIAQEDRATWAFSFVPGLRQYKLGYKKKAYIYWGAFGGSFVSLMLAQKFNTDYRNSRRDIDQTNNPEEQDHYFDAMKLAKKRRNNCYTVSACLAGGAYVINLIDALLITTKRKALPDNLILSAVVTKPYTGVHVVYRF